MIRTALGPQPAHYVAAVSTPGLAFIAVTPQPTKREWDQNSWWRAILPDLYAQNSGVCNYCASWTPRKSGSVDHYIPKSKDPSRAYNWENFRFARATLNEHKGSFEDVVDPFTIQNNWFEMNFVNFEVRPHRDQTGGLRKTIWDTIARLRLNTDNTLINERTNLLYRYSAGKADIAYVEKCYPFMALQIKEQDFDHVYKPVYLKVLAARPWLANG